MVLVTTAVEDNSFDTGGLGALSDEFANALGLGSLVAVECTKVGLDCGGASHGQDLGVIDNLDEYVAC